MDKNENIIKESDISTKLDFTAFRSVLKKEENLLGKKEFNGIQFFRKYILHFNDTFIRLYYTNVKQVDGNRSNLHANLCIIHGFGHHSGFFLEMAYELAKQGINCHLIDLRSHGFSGGSRFDFTIEQLHQDIITLIKQAESDMPELPLYIFGHSMGGGLVSSLFINNQYLQIHGFPKNVDIDAGKMFFMSKFGGTMKEFIMNGNINPSQLTKDDKELIMIMNDNKVMPITGMGSMRSLIKLMERIIENARKFTLPCLIFHGKMDKITNIEHSKTFYDTIRSKIKELVVYDNGFHEMYIDFEKEDMFSKMLHWIKTNKSLGKTDFPFPVDITIGSPKHNVFKFRFGFIVKLVLMLLYIYFGYRLRNDIKSKLGRIFWPISLISQIYRSYFLFEN